MLILIEFLEHTLDMYDIQHPLLSKIIVFSMSKQIQGPNKTDYCTRAKSRKLSKNSEDCTKEISVLDSHSLKLKSLLPARFSVFC